ncbi:hypothetical protein D3C84_905090 [compost metagenome]
MPPAISAAAILPLPLPMVEPMATPARPPITVPACSLLIPSCAQDVVEAMATARRDATNFLRKWSTPFSVGRTAAYRSQWLAAAFEFVRGFQKVCSTGRRRQFSRPARGAGGDQYGAKHPTNPCQEEFIAQRA